MSGLGAFFQVWGAVVAMGLAGRCVLAGRLGPGFQILAGWGLAALLLTAWGVLTPWPLVWPALVFLLLSPLGLLVGHDSLLEDSILAFRILTVGLPLLAVTATIAPSQPDALLAFIPKAAFLADHGFFPYQGGPPIHTDVPVAPYGTELAVYLAVMAGGGPFSASMPALFGIALHLVAGLVFAGVLAGEGRPGWAHAAGGLALATLLNPGFVPRVSFAGYGEAPLSIALMAAGWLTLGVFQSGEKVRLVALALVLSALVLIKQQGIALMAAFAGGVCLAALIHRADRRTIVFLALSFVPAIVLYAAWRFHVTLRFPDGELRAMPFRLWAWGAIPSILADMGRVVVRQSLYFALAAAVMVLSLRSPSFLSITARRAAVVFSGAFLLYNGFLFMTFVAHFGAEHSLFRYNTHMALLLVLSLVLAFGKGFTRLSGYKWGLPAMMAVMVCAPVAAWVLLRFDKDWPQPRLRQLAAQAAFSIEPGAKVAFVLPGDNGSVAEELNAFLRYVDPRRPDLEARFIRADGASEGLRSAQDEGAHLAVLSCTTGMGGALPDGVAALLALEDGRWVARAVWPYDPAPRRTWWNWTGFLAGEPLCL